MPQSRSIRTPSSHVYQSPGSLGPWSARMRWAGAVLVTLLGLLVTPSWAIDEQSSRATLRGLPGVEVSIEALAPEVEQAGLTRQHLQTDVELRLRLAGIRVLTHEERLTAVGQPWLYVNVNVALNRTLGLTVYNIDVELYQKVFLDTGAVTSGVPAVTWDKGMMGTRAMNDFSNIRESLRGQIDAFIDAYLSVNPRPTGGPAPAPAPRPARRTR